MKRGNPRQVDATRDAFSSHKHVHSRKFKWHAEIEAFLAVKPSLTGALFCTGAGLQQPLLRPLGVTLVLDKYCFPLSAGRSVVLANREGIIAEGSLRKAQGNRFVDSHKMNALLAARGMGGYVKPVHGLWQVESVLFLSTFLRHNNKFPKNFSFSLKLAEIKRSGSNGYQKKCVLQDMGGFHYCFSI
ncbi:MULTISPECIES: hypothetical protein [unclassified Synechococcus]|uniref:hypothetical protein n=1 Tax=unclassified Synechococcus TaxID=2626047 RepID=UPI002001AB3E|nr:hypothetical protein [Synechococcus sp. A10-1-5-1]UPM50000.1 hypothetical protein MY494_11900 [Synechococcus sp. A10-1-5-1]